MFNNKLTKKVLSITSAIAIMGAMAIPSLAAPTDPVKGNVQVLYTSGNIIPGPDGTSWGVEIPSGVSFTDADLNVEKKGAEYDLRLVSLDANGKKLEDVYQALTIDVKVSSKNAYQFTKANGGQNQKSGRYEYKANGQIVQATDATDKAIGTMDITATAKREIKGIFTLKEKITEKGSYNDVLTYTFTQTAATPKK